MSLKKIVVANYLGQGWIALMGVAFVPLYVKHLGMEAYGLIGVFASLQAWLTLLDMGMTPTLNREMARYTAGAHTAQSIRDMLRSLEVICIAIAVLIVMLVWRSAPWFSESWFQVEKLSPEEVAQAISIMGIVIALRFVESLYRGAILGLQMQVWLSSVGAGLATLRGMGAVSVLLWVRSDIEVFFAWQGLVSLLTVLIYAAAVYRHMPPSAKSAQFSYYQFKNIRKFAGGVMATTFLSLLLMQVDKIILSRMLSLEMFGYYTLAGTVAATLYQLVTPIAQAYYPRFTQLVTKKDTDGLIRAYHKSSQLLSVLIIPVALMLMFFGEDVLVLWTGDAALAHTLNPILVLLTLGTMLHGLMHIPYTLTLAYGWTGWGVRQNIVAVIIFVPAILWVTPRYSAIGAAWMWVILNTGYVLMSVHILHKRLLTDEKWRWYLCDVMSPAFAAMIVVFSFWLMKPDFEIKLLEVIWLLMSGMCAAVSAALATSSTRRYFLRFVCVGEKLV
jgi:O-antigen/teichoic acid export membrane protein